MVRELNKTQAAGDVSRDEMQAAVNLGGMFTGSTLSNGQHPRTYYSAVTFRRMHGHHRVKT